MRNLVCYTHNLRSRKIAAHIDESADLATAGDTRENVDEIVGIAIDSMDSAHMTRYTLTRSGTLCGFSSAGQLLACGHLSNSGDEITPTADNTTRTVDGWLCLSFIAELERLCAVHSQGSIVLADPSALPEVPGGSDFDDTISDITSIPSEVVGVFDAGIAAATWSADQCQLLVVTRDSKLVLLTSDWQVLAENSTAIPLTTHVTADMDPHMDVSVSAAWRGDGAYFAVNGVEGSLRVLRVYAQDGSALFKGHAEDGSEVRALHQSIAWSPDGALIAVGQDVPGKNRVQVAFFETNGLRHRELTLPGVLPGGVRVGYIGWNADSDILAVQVVASSSASHGSTLQLWHRDNYHWYAKHAMHFERGALGYASAGSICWDPEKALRLHCASAQPVIAGTGHKDAVACWWQTKDFVWDYTAAAGQHTTVATLDESSRIQLTPANIAIVPPPAAYCTLQLAPMGAGMAAMIPQEVAFFEQDPSGSTDDSDRTVGLATLCSNDMIMLAQLQYHLPAVARPPNSAECIMKMQNLPVRHIGSLPASTEAACTTGAAGDMGSADIQNCSWINIHSIAGRVDNKTTASTLLPQSIRQLTWLSTDGDSLRLAAIASGVIIDGHLATHDHVIVITVAHRSSASPEMSWHVLAASAVPGQRIVKTKRSTRSNEILVLYANGVARFIQLEEGSSSDTGLTVEPSWQVELLPMAECSEQPVIVSVSHKSHKLFANSVLLCPAVSSMLHSRTHGIILFSTLGPTPALTAIFTDDVIAAARGQKLALTAVSADAGNDILRRSGNDPRALERGTRLVAVIEKQDAVLLQMPRGNCEGITPRILTLASIRRALDTHPSAQFARALELCRKHRVDMNILYDHRPSLFDEWDNMLQAVADVAQQSRDASVGGPAVHRKAAQLHGTDRWDLFLSALEPADVASTKYPNPTSYVQRDGDLRACPDVPACIIEFDPTIRAHLDGNSKINKACSAVRFALLRVMMTAHRDGTWSINFCHPLVLSVITSFARQVPADLEFMLKTVQRVAAQELSNRQPVNGHFVSGDAALSHAILVADSDVELLYTTALGMYDLPLAHTLAQRGQSDPREYVPFLGFLVKLAKDDAMFGTLKQRWAIDCHLGRWKKAVSWLGQVASATMPDRVDDGGRAARLAALMAMGAGDASKPRDNSVTSRVVDENIMRALRCAPSDVGRVLSLHAKETNETEHLVNAGLEEPLLVALCVAAAHDALGDLLAALPGDKGSSVRRLVTLERGWRVLKPAVISTDADAVDHNLARLFQTVAPPYCSWNATVEANKEDFDKAIQFFMVDCKPPAIDEALVVTAARSFSRNSSNSAGRPYYRCTVELAAHPACMLRLRRLPKHINDSSFMVPSVHTFVSDLCATLCAQGSRAAGELAESQVAAAAHLMTSFNIDVERAVELFCSVRLWHEASEAAAAHGRLDLVDTIILPSLATRAQEAIVEVEARRDAARRSIAQLAACRDMRLKMTLSELLGVSEAARLIARARGAAAQDGQEGGDNMDEQDVDDGGSVWTDASSVMSARDDHASYVSGTESQASFSSGKSGYSKCSGKFSHLAKSALPTTFTNMKSTLRMTESDLTPSQIATNDAAMATKIVDRWEARRSGETTHARHEKSRRKAASKALRVRPGSKGEEQALETELSKVLPTSTGDWFRHLQELASALIFFGRADLANKIHSAYRELLQELTDSPVPTPRRNIKSEIKELYGGAEDVALDEILLPLISYETLDPSETLMNARVSLGALRMEM